MGVDVMLYIRLASALDGGKLSAAHLGRHNPKESVPSTP